MPDETLHPGQGSTAKDDPALPNHSPASEDGAATLVPQGPPAGTLVPGDPAAQLGVRANPAARAGLPSAIGPTDATLNASDPETQRYHQAALASKPATDQGGTTFGDYDLLEPIAKGGMGIVYKARQRKLNRIVAIKMILAGQFADQADIDRFYAEAEAAAALSHPNIVAIHEVGEINGQHFFSMDYIDGESLAHLVQENPLRPRRAAEFTKIIAETVQFAHDNGVVHRDLKPANVLLDKRQRPLITDFGLAKQVSSQSQRTMAGSIVGTPSYMPPEQAAGRVDEIGPWSDLYSLGAILYELLTGRPPFRSASPFETIRQVLETEPLSPRLLNESIPKDLETICLKCLQKDRSRRYASCQELADELHRFLRGEPIQARPISRAERLWRLARRYPVTSSAIVAAVLMLCVGLAAVMVAYVQTSRALVAERESSRKLTKAVNDWFTSVSDNTLLNQPGMQPLRKELYEKALTYYQEFAQQKVRDPRLEDEISVALFKIAQITEVLKSPDEALPLYERARRMQIALLEKQPQNKNRMRALGETHNAVGTLFLKNKEFDKANAEYEAAAAVRQNLAAADPDNGDYQRELANTHMNLGMAEYKRRRLVPARQQFEEAQRIRLTALAKHPEQPRLQRDLAKAYYNLGYMDSAEGNSAGAENNFKKAAAALEPLAAARPAELDNLEVEKLLAICYRTLGDASDDPAARREYYQRALARLEPLAIQNPAVAEFQTERAAALLNLSDLELTAGNQEKARLALQQARDIYQLLVERHPAENAWFQRDLAVTLRELSRLQHEAGQNQAAQASLQRAIEILTDLVQQKPNEPEFAAALAATKEVQLQP